MQSEHALGKMHCLRELGDRDRGGVRGDHAVISGGAVDRPHHLELQIQALGHGLDHEIRAGDRLQLGRKLDPLTRVAGLRRVELAARRLARAKTRSCPVPARCRPRRRRVARPGCRRRPRTRRSRNPSGPRPRRRRTRYRMGCSPRGSLLTWAFSGGGSSAPPRRKRRASSTALLKSPRSSHKPPSSRRCCARHCERAARGCRQCRLVRDPRGPRKPRAHAADVIANVPTQNHRSRVDRRLDSHADAGV